MKILKFKKKPNGKYSVYLDDGREFVYYEEVILQYELLLKKEVEEKDLLTIHQTNLEYDVYYVALNSIKSRFKSIYELREFLRKKEYPEEMIDHAIDKLIEQRYLDDRLFAKSYINTQMITTSHGPLRIKNDLYNKKVSSSIIEEEIALFDEESQIEKMKKIINDLKTQGYEYDLISRIISSYSFPQDKDLAKKEYDKLYKKYSSKYEGYELANKIREKMFQKGLTYEEE